MSLNKCYQSPPKLLAGNCTLAFLLKQTENKPLTQSLVRVDHLYLLSVIFKGEFGRSWSHLCAAKQQKSSGTHRNGTSRAFLKVEALTNEKAGLIGSDLRS